LENTDFRAGDEFSRAAYGPGHPNRNATVDERIAALESAKLEDLRAFHAAHYGPAHLVLVAAGDLDVAGLQTALTTSFTGWSGGTPELAAVQNSATDAAREQTVFMADKTSVSIVIGQPTGLRYGEGDHIALRTGTAILGSGFTGRLMANVRDKEGLTYGIGSTVTNDNYTDGEWKIVATFAPALLDKGIASTKRQLDNWYQNGVTADELEKRQDNLVGSFQVGLATTDGLAQNLLASVHRGKDVTWLDDYPKVVRALTVDQINGAIKKHLNPEQMFLIKAGTVPGAAK
ncbi:MAG: insulinase family protein, partial [Candidatus Didemnitutus sp.]|nr:insulinase family protein [Candidatus Didemnitutus sp.]